jgi:hypothetical protein
MPPAPRRIPGTITLDVDATNLSQRVFQVTERIPVQAGPLTLLFPKWLPGNHADYGRVDKVAGLVITANGKRLEWVRDPLDVFAFKVDVPQGATNSTSNSSSSRPPAATRAAWS